MRGDWDFQLSTRVRFGRGTLDEVGPLTADLGKSALLVGYADRSGLEEAYRKAERSLEAAGLRVTAFDRITPDPGAPLAREGADRAREAGADVVVALGGGSVLDVAKGIAALARSGATVWDHTKANPNYRPIEDALPVVAVPTTAGTGSEVTNVAVFTHEGVGPQAGVALKAAIFGDALRPKLAVVDPDLLTGCPPKQTAACGADALAHAIEACLSRNANPIATALARRAVALLAGNLLRAVEAPRDPEPRDALALASLLAGAAINTAGVVVAHVLAHGLGGVLHLPHALAVAICTPIGLRFNAESCRDTYAELAGSWGLSGESPDEDASQFVEAVCALLRDLDLPAKPSVLPGASENLPGALAQNAILSTPVAAGNNPRPVDESVLRELYVQLLG